MFIIKHMCIWTVFGYILCWGRSREDQRWCHMWNVLVLLSVKEWSRVGSSQTCTHIFASSVSLIQTWVFPVASWSTCDQTCSCSLPALNIYGLQKVLACKYFQVRNLILKQSKLNYKWVLVSHLPLEAQNWARNKNLNMMFSFETHLWNSLIKYLSKSIQTFSHRETPIGIKLTFKLHIFH